MKNAGYIDPSLLENLHGQFREETLIWYDEQSKLGDESFIERYRHKLSELINQQFAFYEQRNIAERVSEIEPLIYKRYNKLINI